MVVGRNAGCTGILDISGDGIVTNSQALIIGENASATGTVSVAGNGKYLIGTAANIGQADNTVALIEATENAEILVRDSLTLGRGDGALATVDFAGKSLIISNEFTIGYGYLDYKTKQVDDGSGNTVTAVLVDGENKAQYSSGHGTGIVTIGGGDVYVKSHVNIGHGQFGNNTTWNWKIASMDDTTATEATISDSTSVQAVGEMVINGGNVVVNEDPYVGLRGQGTLTINGGSMKVCGADNSARWAIFNKWNDGFMGTSTINLNGGVLEVERIAPGYNTTATGVVNFNGGTLKAFGDQELIYNSALITINVKAGGMIIDVPEGVEASIPVERLATDASLGGIVKEGKGTLTLKGVGGEGAYNPIPVTGYVKVLEGKLQCWDGGQFTKLDKVYVAENAVFNMQYTPDLTVRSLVLDGEGDSKGKIENSTITQASETLPTLYKAVWTGARSDDVSDPANWALYYNDREQDVRVSADELPTADTTIYYAASIYDALPDMSALTYAKKVLVLPAETVALKATGAMTFEETYNLSDWYLDASAATLSVSNAKTLASGTFVPAITCAGLESGFANVTSDPAEAEVKVSCSDGAVNVARRGGFSVRIR